MQYWLFAHAYYKGNQLIGKYETFEEANLNRSRLDKIMYNYADIVRMEWGKEPKIVSSQNFWLDKQSYKVKKIK